MSNLVVQTNVLALNSHRNLKTVGVKQFQSSARLSSGYRINSAADDAAGLAISEKMRAQIRGLDMASKNTQDGISLIQTAEGAMQEIDNMIQRIRELVVQGANDTNDYRTADRKKLQDEIDQLTQGIDAMATSVEFNAKKLIDGSLMDSASKGALLADINVKLQNLIGSTYASSFSNIAGLATALSVNSGRLGALLGQAVSMGTVIAASLNVSYVVTVQVDVNTIQTIGLTAAAASYVLLAVNGAPTVAAAVAAAAADTVSLKGVSTLNLMSADRVSQYIGEVDKYISALQDAKKAGKDVDNLLKALAYNRQAALEIYAGLELTAAITKSYTELNKVQGTGLWFQTGANSVQGINVGIGKITSDILGIGLGSGISTIKVDRSNAYIVSSQIDIVDNALQYVTSQRAKLGAVQNRLEFTKTSLDISSENLSASESRIRDTDMAKEMMKLTATNILQQSGVSMLAQANQNPQSVLQLLR